MSPALAGGFLTTAPPGKSPCSFLPHLLAGCRRSGGREDWKVPGESEAIKWKEFGSLNACRKAAPFPLECDMSKK